MNKTIITVLFFFIGLVVLSNSAFIVDEGRQAIITEFGRPIGDPITEANIHFKVPFIQDVRFVDKRILNWDGYPNQIPTKDKKYIKVDTTARWKIIDTLKFIQTVKNENGAKGRLDSIIDGATRDVVSNHNLVEVVRNSNTIIDRVEEMKKIISEGKEDLSEEVKVLANIQVEKINVGREKLSQMIVDSAQKELNNLGIELIDVQLRRISYEKSVEAKVYERMISERKKIAQKIRSLGQGEKAKIEGRLTRDLQEIESNAYRKAQEIRGKLEAKAMKIYNQALSKGKNYFEFLRSMEAYEKVMKEKSKFILSSDSEFLKYFKKTP
ncbi:MAG: protease modulator HflC [Bacteriovoracaceae bacterium]